MRIVVVGLGYVGVTAAACLTKQGHVVCGVDVNPEKVEAINSGVSPIVEPGIDDMLASAVAQRRLSAQTSIPPLLGVDLVVVCVGTPSAADGAHNMSYIAESTRQIAVAARAATAKVTVAYRSTVRPGSMENFVAPLFRSSLGEDWASTIELVYNPEFLRESTAVEDYFNPPRVVVGTADGRGSCVMTQLNQDISAPVFLTRFREAEVTKFIDNSWHAVKVTFANEFGRVCAANGVDADIAHSIFVSDTKLNISNYYTRPGSPFGGSCLPKDVRAMQYLARVGGIEVELLDSVIKSNESHKRFQFSRVRAAAEPGAKVLVVGLAFKAGTDDLRESPHVSLVADLLAAGYRVDVLDPAVRASMLVGQNLATALTILPQLHDIIVDIDKATECVYDVAVINHGSCVPEGVIARTLIDLQRVQDSLPALGGEPGRDS